MAGEAITYANAVSSVPSQAVTQRKIFSCRINQAVFITLQYERRLVEELGERDRISLGSEALVHDESVDIAMNRVSEGALKRANSFETQAGP